MIIVLRKMGEIYKLYTGLHAEPQGAAAFPEFYETRPLSVHKIYINSSSYR